MSEKDTIRELRKLINEVPGIAQKAMDFTMSKSELKAKKTKAFQDQTGNLRNAIKGEAEKPKRTEVSGVLSDSMEYAPHIELGTSRMAARPFLWPAIRDVVIARKTFERRFAALLKAKFR